MSTSGLAVSIDCPGSKPKKPSKPRKPRIVSVQTREVWHSENEGCTLAEILSAIPRNVPADAIRIEVERNPNGFVYTRVVYDHEFPNTRYTEQMDEYERRIQLYEQELKAWEEVCRSWEDQSDVYQQRMRDVQLIVDEAFQQYAV